MTEPGYHVDIETTPPPPKPNEERNAAPAWAILIVGLLWLTHHFAHFIDMRVVGPSLCIALGVYLLLKNQQRKQNA